MFALSVDDLALDRDRFDEQLDRLINSGRRYGRPLDVLTDESLDDAGKRAVLSAWASDANAVDSAPSLRRPPFADQTVTIDEVMAALGKLDEAVLGHVASSVQGMSWRRNVRQPSPGRMAA